MLKAFWRSAPAVRFMVFTTLLMGDLFFECDLSSRSSALVHARRTTRLFAFLAIVSFSMFAALKAAPTVFSYNAQFGFARCV